MYISDLNLVCKYSQILSNFVFAIYHIISAYRYTVHRRNGHHINPKTLRERIQHRDQKGYENEPNIFQRHNS